MKIRFTNQNSLKYGKEEHVENSVGHTLIAMGEAVEVARAPRGTPAWHREMVELETLRVSRIPAAQLQTVPTTPQWTVRFLEQARKYIVVRDSAVGQTFYEERTVWDGKGRPDFRAAEKQFIAALKAVGCPQKIIQLWQDSKNSPDFLAQEQSRLEAAKRAAEEQREREKHINSIELFPQDLFTAYDPWWTLYDDTLSTMTCGATPCHLIYAAAIANAAAGVPTATSIVQGNVTLQGGQPQTGLPTVPGVVVQ